MSRKKKSEEVLPQALDANVLEQDKYLTTEEMLKMQLFEEEAVAGDAQTRLLMYEKDAYIRQIDPQGKLGELIRGIQEASKKNANAKTKAKELKASIEARLNIKLEEYAYNEVTGQLNKVES